MFEKFIVLVRRRNCIQWYLERVILYLTIGKGALKIEYLNIQAHIKFLMLNEYCSFDIV